ncbi:MAG: PKD domain-containing protein, partial [Bacteroidota bacterium]
MYRALLRLTTLLLLLTTLFPKEAEAQCPVIPDFSFQISCTNFGLVQFTDQTSTIPPGAIQTWLWKFGDGESLANWPNPTHTYDSAGIYYCKLVVWDTSGCKETVTKAIFITPLPVADFVYSPSSLECANIPIFFDTRTLSTGVGLKYTWYFGDGTSVTTRNDTISHRYYSWAGSNCGIKETFNVTLVISDTNGCQDNTSQTVDVGPLPYANLLDANNNNFQLCNYTTSGLVQDTLCVDNWVE